MNIDRKLLEEYLLCYDIKGLSINGIYERNLRKKELGHMIFNHGVRHDVYLLNELIESMADFYNTNYGKIDVEKIIKALEALGVEVTE